MTEWWLSLDLESRRRAFVAGIALAAGVVFWSFKRARDRELGESRFQTREAERKSAQGHKPSRLAEAKIAPRAANAAGTSGAERPPQAPLALSGIRLGVPAHELLGVARDATPKEIQLAFRELMKRYHPDAVGPQGSQAWKDAGEIAQALQEARDAMLARRSP